MRSGPEKARGWGREPAGETLPPFLHYSSRLKKRDRSNCPLNRLIVKQSQDKKAGYGYNQVTIFLRLEVFHGTCTFPKRRKKVWPREGSKFSKHSLRSRR